MSDWTWEYVPDAANVVGGLTQKQIDEVESLALRQDTQERGDRSGLAPVAG
jgi:hypothetical protein